MTKDKCEKCGAANSHTMNSGAKIIKNKLESKAKEFLKKYPLMFTDIWVEHEDEDMFWVHVTLTDGKSTAFTTRGYQEKSWDNLIKRFNLPK